MRNPFTVLKSAVSRLFKGQEVRQRVGKSKPLKAEPLLVEIKTTKREPAPVDPRGYIPSQRVRNQRRKARADVRSFVRMLNQGREDHGL